LFIKRIHDRFAFSVSPGIDCRRASRRFVYANFQRHGGAVT